jgi:hypothetical protein
MSRHIWASDSNDQYIATGSVRRLYDSIQAVGLLKGRSETPHSVSMFVACDDYIALATYEYLLERFVFVVEVVGIANGLQETIIKRQRGRVNIE